MYWHGENRRVLRGHWFARKGGLDWLPLREDVAEQLELAYRCQVLEKINLQFSINLDSLVLAISILHVYLLHSDEFVQIFNLGFLQELQLTIYKLMNS